MPRNIDDKAAGGPSIPVRSEHNLAAWNRARQQSDRAARNRAAEAAPTEPPAGGPPTGPRRETGPSGREG
jgi:hypothetical protein